MTTMGLPPLLRQQLVEACQRLAAGPGLPTEADVLDEMAHNFHVGVALYRAFLTSVGDSFGLAVRDVAERQGARHPLAGEGVGRRACAS